MDIASEGRTVSRYLFWSTVFSMAIAVASAAAAYLALLTEVRILATMAAALSIFVGSWLLRRLRHAALALARTHERLVESEVRSTAALIASSIGHDINNVLVVCGAHIEDLEEAANEPAAIAGLSLDFERSASEIAALARRLLDASKLQLAPAFSDGAVGSAVAPALEIASAHPAVRKCRFDPEPIPDVRARLSAPLLSRALLNLIVNAADAAGPGGRVAVRFRVGQGTFTTEVHDSGPGVSEPERSRILEPFYSSKVGGTGLGLVVVRECARQHSGQLEITDSDLGGACFRLVIPTHAHGLA